jgi:hypothetical protein
MVLLNVAKVGNQTTIRKPARTHDKPQDQATGHTTPVPTTVDTLAATTTEQRLAPATTTATPEPTMIVHTTAGAVTTSVADTTAAPTNGEVTTGGTTTVADMRIVPQGTMSRAGTR